jgi:hypothetical protein
MKKHAILGLLTFFFLANSIYSYDFKKVEVIFRKNVNSLSENSVRNIVEKALKDVLDADPYYKTITHVYSNDKGVPEFLVTYLLRSDCLLYESYKINLDKNTAILSIQKNFENPDVREESKICSTCPDPDVEVYVESSMDGAPLGAAEWVYSVALGAGYKTVKDIQANATSARYKQFITCPKIKCVVHVGHGNNEKGIMFAMDDIRYEWFAALPKNYLVQQVHLYGSCLIQNDPFRSAFLGTGVEAFMAGKSTIDITTLQNTMFAISNGIFYKKEVKASFEATDARSKGWDISGNPPNGPWYVEKAPTPISFLIPWPEPKTPDLLCRYSKADQKITVTYLSKQNPGVSGQIVTLDVYTVEGKRIANLVNGQKTADTYKATINTSDLVNGVYAVRLTMGNKNISARTVIYR